MAISYLQFIELRNSSKTQKAREPQNQVNQKAVLKTAPSFALRTPNNFFMSESFSYPKWATDLALSFLAAKPNKEEAASKSVYIRADLY